MLSRDAYVKDYYWKLFVRKEEYDQYQIGLKYWSVYQQLFLYFMSFRCDGEFSDVLGMILSLSFQLALRERIYYALATSGFRLIHHWRYDIIFPKDMGCDENNLHGVSDVYDGFIVKLEGHDFFIPHLFLCDDWLEKRLIDKKVDLFYRYEIFRALSPFLLICFVMLIIFI
jgi:hypothetical protein